MLKPGQHEIDNRPGFGIKNDNGIAKAIESGPNGAVLPNANIFNLTNDSTFDLNQENNILYKFNSVHGGVIVPRGTSVVGLDLRKTRIRPKYVPNPTTSYDKDPKTAIFRITGTCYFWQFSVFDGDESKLVYTDNGNFSPTFNVKPVFSHHKLTCKERFELFFDEGIYEIIKTPIPGDENPLKWEDVKPYKNRLEDAKKKTGQDCAIMVAKGKINNIEVIAAASNFEFLGGSVSIAESEAIVYAVQNAIDNKIPFVNFCSGGGMRMMASAVSLTAGMGKTTIAINELKKSKLPYIVCIVDPCAGGISASYGMTADVIFGESGALCAFAGRRVVQATVKEELPSDFQSVEFLEKHGFIDKVIHRRDLASEIGNILSILLNKNTEVNLTANNETSENIEQITKAAS